MSESQKRPRDQGKDGVKPKHQAQATGDSQHHNYANTSSDHVHAEIVSPESKKGKKEPTPSEMQDNIVRLVAEKIAEHTSGIAKDVKELKQDSQAMVKDIQEVIQKIQTIEETTTAHEGRIALLEEKLNDMERQHRRQNLRLHGLSEMEGEDVKKRIINICNMIFPDAVNDMPYNVDIAHRLGRRQENKTRPVIIRFASRSFRDDTWRASKELQTLREMKLTFSEELTQKPKETRSRLWPYVDAARKEQKKAFFVGAKAIIDGKEFKI